jgi:hypothetical protein
MKLLIVDFRPGQGRHGPLEHGQAVRRRSLARGFEGRLTRGKEAQAIGAGGGPGSSGHR